MENENWEIYIMFFFGWFVSSAVCFFTLTIYWFGLSIDVWNFELTLLAIITFGILGVLIIITLISVFLHRFKIVYRE